jgi:hypothetical protein
MKSQAPPRQDRLLPIRLDSSHLRRRLLVSDIVLDIRQEQKDVLANQVRRPPSGNQPG